VDLIVLKIIDNGENFLVLDNSIKSQLLSISTIDVQFEKGRSPLMIGMQNTTSSLAKCYELSMRKINYPSILNFDAKRISKYKIEKDNAMAKATEDEAYYDQVANEGE
jgi:CRISPR-associated protein Cas1